MIDQSNLVLMVDHEAVYFCRVLDIEQPAYGKLNELMEQDGSSSASTTSCRSSSPAATRVDCIQIEGGEVDLE
jgi:hypothetical protein